MEYPSAVILDLDVTLLDKQKQVSPRNLSAVRLLRRHEIPVIIATARPYRSVCQLLPAELLHLGPMICYNGAAVRRSAHGSFETEAVPAHLVEELLVHLAAQAPGQFVCFESGGCLYSDRPVRTEELGILGMPADAPLPDVLPDTQRRLQPIAKLLLRDSGGLHAGLQRQFGASVNCLLTDGGELIQIMAAGAAKEAAVASIAAEYGYEAGRMLAFGDDLNDLGLFHFCGYPVAMGNAVPELKACAWRAASSNEEDGVAEVIEAWLQQGDSLTG